jgi:hypothetical protein
VPGRGAAEDIEEISLKFFARCVDVGTIWRESR